jgi:hypothetical protein
VCVCVCMHMREREIMCDWKEKTLTHCDFKGDGTLQDIACCWSNQLHLKDLKHQKITKIHCAISKRIVLSICTA